jgi:hypothetical protein
MTEPLMDYRIEVITLSVRDVGFAPATTYELLWDARSYPPKAILGTAYEFATGRRLASGDFEGGKAGAVRVLGKLGFTVQHAHPGS